MPACGKACEHHVQRSIARLRPHDTMRIDTELFASKDIELSRKVDPMPFVPAGKALNERCEEIFAIQIAGLAKRLVHTQTQTVVIGISGGLDSTLPCWSAPRRSTN